ncbi:Lrp/AsnC family transcriptional regulator [Microtetraspora malaysiensis]|uniref:Lrp/AsnC family transcriptional regulator n=1 Tax=Microtetraspora malaysiensis TaxID=161358 RepID=UPI003D9491D5
MEPLGLDERDLAIVAALHVDGRLQWGKLGEILGLSDRTVARRAKRLIERGVGRIVGVVNPYQRWVHCQVGDGVQQGLEAGDLVGLLTDVHLGQDQAGMCSMAASRWILRRIPWRRRAGSCHPPTLRAGQWRRPPSGGGQPASGRLLDPVRRRRCGPAVGAPSILRAPAGVPVASAGMPTDMPLACIDRQGSGLAHRPETSA